MSSFSSATHSTLLYKMASRGCFIRLHQKKKYLKNQILGGKGWQSRQLQICYKIKRGMVKIYQKRREQRRKNPPHPCCLQQKVAHIYFVPATCFFSFLARLQEGWTSKNAGFAPQLNEEVLTSE